jgi:hypothetical protein
MFSPANITAVAPRSAPFLPVYDENSGINAYLENLRANDDTTKAALLAIIGALAIASGNNQNRELSHNCSSMFLPGASASIAEFLSDNQVRAAENEENISDNNRIRISAHSQLNTAVKWICDLVNASKKKEIDGSNVEGYFAGLGRSNVKGTPIASLINQVSNFLPDNIMDLNFRDSLTDNIWTKYHTSRVSTGKLLFDIREDFIALEIFEEGDEVDNNIIYSKDNPHNVSASYDIPKKVVGYASLFYQTAGVDVGQWYQGEKYEMEIPAARVRSIKEIFRKYLELKNRIGDIEESTSIEQLNDAIGDDFW